MLTLRLTQSSLDGTRYRVETSLEGERLPRQIAVAEFEFQLTAQDREDFRWYLEDYLQHSEDPAPAIAARIERRIADVGEELFAAVFQSSEDARDLWATLRLRLSDTRVEIVSGVVEAASLPWELLRDPKTDTPLALRARAFVRAAHRTAQLPKIWKDNDLPIRVLLVICRPGGSDDVPFRSVASRLIKSLTESASEAFQLDVLRPPTFEQLSRVLRSAKRSEKPYHVVHFDGHGAFADIADNDSAASTRRALSSLVLSASRTGAHGYLLFENPAVTENLQFVDGPAVGRVLAETDVPVLVLNACRSAHAEAPAMPDTTGDAASDVDVHNQVRAFGSLAQEVVDAGVAAVVAMRYNVYVVTAAQFVADLYESFAGGQSVGEAVTLGRKQMEAQPLREIAWQPRALQDWMVPIVYEAAPVTLFPEARKTTLSITVRADATTSSSHPIPHEIEQRPDVGFFGRDETLLALDRAFDHQAIVLLHAWAGSGKTSTAAEFARWYHATGGLSGPVLFTSFEQHKALAQVLNESIGAVFNDALEQASIHWLALSENDRRDVALQVMAQIPVLWIWDNVEPIAGFPEGTRSAWTDDEERELSDFLRSASRTKAKFLLTSRRDEKELLGDLPTRIHIPPMPMQERVQLARALAERNGRRLGDVQTWLPLLRFAGGNPLTITVLIGQALRDGLSTKDQIEAFVAQLRLGEASLEDEASEGRERSLGASLNYGFEHSFSADERQKLALLYFFQGFVDVSSLVYMATPDAAWSLSELRGLTREDAIALMDRASEIGLLAKHSFGFYSIHPALPWFFKSLFARHYPDMPVYDNQSPKIRAMRAFVESLGGLGDAYHRQYNQGNSRIVNLLRLQDANLLAAREMAIAHGWWEPLMGTMQGLRTLYQHTGRRAEWARSVEEVVPHLIDRSTGGPIAGMEEFWTLIMDYRINNAVSAHQWNEAECLQARTVAIHKTDAELALSVAPDRLSNHDKYAIGMLARSLLLLGHIQQKRNDPQCVEVIKNALSLFQRLNDRRGEAITSFNLGHAYKDVPSIRDLGAAEMWYRHSLAIHADESLDRAKCLSQLGSVAYARFIAAMEANEPESVLLEHLNFALQSYQEALQLDPADAPDELSIDHDALAIIYAAAGDFEQAFSHWHESIRYSEAAGNLRRAALSRKKFAQGLLQAGRHADAMDYARAALQGFSVLGPAAENELEDVKKLILLIQKMSKHSIQ